MGPKKSKLSKDVGIQMVTDMLYSGKTRKVILQEIGNEYDLSDSTIDNWIRDSKPVVAKMLNDDAFIRDQVNAEQVAASAIKLNISRERIMNRLSQIAFGDPRVAIFTVDGGLKAPNDWTDDGAGMIAGVETADEKVLFKDESVDTVTMGSTKKVKLLSPLGAIEILNKMLGYNLPEKAPAGAPTDGPALDMTKLDDTVLAAILNARKSTQ